MKFFIAAAAAYVAAADPKTCSQCSGATAAYSVTITGSDVVTACAASCTAAYNMDKIVLCASDSTKCGNIPKLTLDTGDILTEGKYKLKAACYAKTDCPTCRKDTCHWDTDKASTPKSGCVDADLHKALGSNVAEDTTCTDQATCASCEGSYKVEIKGTAVTTSCVKKAADCKASNNPTDLVLCYAKTACSSIPAVPLESGDIKVAGTYKSTDECLKHMGSCTSCYEVDAAKTCSFVQNKASNKGCLSKVLVDATTELTPIAKDKCPQDSSSMTIAGSLAAAVTVVAAWLI